MYTKYKILIFSDETPSFSLVLVARGQEDGKDNWMLIVNSFINNANTILNNLVLISMKITFNN